MEELVIQEINVPAIYGNFEDFKSKLQDEVGRYCVQVTEDTTTQAKKLMADLNKIKGAIKDREKEILDVFRAPVDSFKDKIKELVAICDNSRQQIATQVEVFENATKDTCKNLISETVASLRDDYKIASAYRLSSFDDLVKLTSISNGKLTKACKDAILSKVLAEKARQDTADKRLLVVENECRKAGLEPYQPDTISHILEAGESDFLSKLQWRIDSDKQAIERALNRERERLENDARIKNEVAISKAKAEIEAKAKAEAKAEAERVARMKAEAETEANEAYYGGEKLRKSLKTKKKVD